MRTITRTAYLLGELSEASRERAVEDFRKNYASFDPEWSHDVLNDITYLLYSLGVYAPKGNNKGYDISFNLDMDAFSMHGIINPDMFFKSIKYKTWLKLHPDSLWWIKSPIQVNLDVHTGREVTSKTGYIHVIDKVAIKAYVLFEGQIEFIRDTLKKVFVEFLSMLAKEYAKLTSVPVVTKTITEMGFEFWEDGQRVIE